jgi:hypothetical protein
LHFGQIPPFFFQTAFSKWLLHFGHIAQSAFAGGIFAFSAFASNQLMSLASDLDYNVVIIPKKRPPCRVGQKSGDSPIFASSAAPS